MAVASQDEAAPSRVVHETFRQSPIVAEQEAIRMEGTQRLGSKTQTVVFHGNGGTLFGIHLVNTLLTLVTLGLYYYWAKVRVRKFLFSQTEFAGDRFSYHGSARELLNGALKAGLVFGIPYYALSNAGHFLDPDMAIKVGLQAAAWLLLLVFIPVAIVSSRRYRLSRTSWRGIRFSFQGKTWEFIKLWLSGYALTVVSLGMYYPYFSTKKHAFLTRQSYFGSEPFQFTADGAALFRPFLKVYLLAVAVAALVALALYSVVPSIVAEPLKNAGDPSALFFLIVAMIAGLVIGALVFRFLLLPYSVTEQRFFWEQTSIGLARFRLPITVRPYLKLKLGNLLLVVCTFGLAWPWTTIRNIRFITDQLTLVGVANFDEVVQAYDGAPPIGEGLDGFLDTGFDLG